MTAMQFCRLTSGGRIDRTSPLNFSFNGQAYTGFAGDTLASALLANGVRVVGRGFKFHRPRGIMSAGVEECNALVKLGRGGFEEPNVRATLQPLYEGLQARSQNCWPSVNYDIHAINDLASALLPAGFYNKTFKWPNWHWYEGSIRRAAGLGTLPPEADPDHYVQKNVHCDVLVCGAGPAGLAAAQVAAQSGARVMLVEQDDKFGGSLLWSDIRIDFRPADAWVTDTLASLHKHKGVTLLKSATVSGYFDHNVLLVTERLRQTHEAGKGPRERLWKVRAKEVILTTGAIEQPLVFPNNDRPGIMLASAVSHFLSRYAVYMGRQVVVATNNDSAYQTALDLDAAGVHVEGIIDCRAQPEGALIDAVRERGITLFQNSFVLNTAGRKGVSKVQIARRNTQAKSGFQRLRTIYCDGLAMSGGWQPAVHLFSQARGKLRYDPAACAYLPDQTPPHLRVAGAANGSVGLNLALSEGQQAGLSAAAAAGFETKPATRIVKGETLAVSCFNTERFFIKHKPQRQWLDFQHDVTLRDIDIAVQENFVSVEHLKRYTTAGMSLDQGKTSNINALAALAEYTGKPPGIVGTTTFRPFYMPTTLGAIAGRRCRDFYAPLQRSPVFFQHESLGAVFWDYGTWRRPAAYPEKGETLADAIQREALAVRSAVGIFDASPLGKIEVRGQSAAEFLNWFYINNVTSLKIGHARYGLMLNEAGVVIDDGIFARLGENHFLVHTTSGAAGRIHAWMEEWQQGEWPGLDVLLTNVTTQWANVTLSGPRARAVLTRLESDIDLDPAAFPHMSLREGTLEGVPARIMRASFTGEPGYEINVPAGYGEALWNCLMEAGKEFGITPYGIESLMVLRTEKGYLHVGADTDGQTIPPDIGWAGPIAKKKADFIGKRSLQLANNQREDRLQFVGLAPANEQQKVCVGAHVINSTDTKAPAPSQGYVTSACYSPELGRWIALGLVKGGCERMGETVNLFHQDKVQAATIVEPTFFDPQGERLHV